jgi:hypothetical protein
MTNEPGYEAYLAVATQRVAQQLGLPVTPALTACVRRAIEAAANATVAHFCDTCALKVAK